MSLFGLNGCDINGISKASGGAKLNLGINIYENIHVYNAHPTESLLLRKKAHTTHWCFCCVISKLYRPCKCSVNANFKMIIF